MNNLHDLLLHRHSIRKYTDEPIDADNVKQILEAALMAPSSKRSTPWQFVLVENKDTLNAMVEMRDMGTVPLTQAQLAVVVMADPAVTDTWIEDASIAAAYLQLQAEDLGLGSCWVQVRGRFTKDGMPTEEFLDKLLNIPADMKILCVITLGHKAEERKPFDPEKMKWEKVHIGEYKDIE